MKQSTKHPLESFKKLRNENANKKSPLIGVYRGKGILFKSYNFESHFLSFELVPDCFLHEAKSWYRLESSFTAFKSSLILFPCKSVLPTSPGNDVI